LLGDSGTGKTHLLIGLGLAVCEQGRRVRYSTTAQLVNELAEAADQRQLSRVVGRYGRLDLLLLDELGYVQLDPRGAELLFQIITEREERASIASPSTPTSSKPAPSPTGSPPATPAIASEPASFGRRPLTAHKRGHWASPAGWERAGYGLREPVPLRRRRSRASVSDSEVMGCPTVC
jgi:IstB-like ATP binding protein